MAFQSFSTLGSINLGPLNNVNNKNKIAITKSSLLNWRIVKPTATIKNWHSISMSSDGTKIILCTFNDLLYRSTDSGNTWFTLSTSGSRNWRTVLSSFDGETLLGGVYPGFIYRSTDGGITWGQVGPTMSQSWGHINNSPNGIRMIACSRGGGIHTSTNSGANWIPSGAGTRSWTSVAISDDGTKIFGGTDGQGIFFSLNSGSSWSQVFNSATMGAFYTMSIFNGGNGLITGSSSVYMTTNTSNLSTVGLSQVTILPTNGDWRASVSSTDGTYLAVGDFGTNSNGIYISNNSGSSWSQQISTKNYKHLQMSASSNCNVICSCIYGGDVFIGN
jgi:hypothetical protein